MTFRNIKLLSMDENIVGVIGAGVMGLGVAQKLAQTNFNVILVDKYPHTIDTARIKMMSSVRFARFFVAGSQKLSAEDVVKNVAFTTQYDSLANASCIIENVTELWSVKREVYKILDSVCDKNCIFCANTSAIPITRIGSATKRPEQVIGIHFMNPVPAKKTVELVLGYHTNSSTVERAKKFLQRLDMNYVIVNDSPGFVTNRVLMLMVNEAIFLVHEQVAAIEEIDRAFKLCMAHSMGPLETADLIGLDTVLYSLEVLYESFNDPKFRPCPLLRKMVEAGLLGRKTGRGFYSYESI